MPYSIRLPDGTLVNNIPDDLNPSDAKKRIISAYPQFAPETTILGQAGEAIKGLVPGAIGLIETGVAGASALLPEDYETAVREKTKEIATAAKKPFEASAGYEDTVGRKLGEAIGSTIPFLAAGPFGLAGRAAAVGLGTAAGAGEARTRAEAEGATAEQRASATGFGIIPGAAEAFAPLRILGRLGDDIVGGGVSYVKRALVAGGEEAAQEAASGFAQNLIAKGIYKPEQELIEGLGEQAAYGGATGAIVQGLLDLAIGRRARGPKAVTTEETEAPPAPPVVTNYQTIDLTGNPVNIRVSQDSAGNIIATGPDGEPVDLSNMVAAGFSIEESIQRVFSAGNEPVVPVSSEVATPEVTPPDVTTKVEPEITAPEIVPPAVPPSVASQITPPREITSTSSEEAPEFEGAEMRPVQQPPMPLPEEIIALDKDAERVVKDIKRAEKQRKGESLAGALKNKLNDSELYDIFGTESPPYFKSGKKSGEGKTIADALADGDLDAFVPDNLIVYDSDSPETVMDKQMETVEYIKNKLRTKNYLTASTESELQRLNFDLKGIEDSLGLEMTDEQIRQEANALAAEIAAEQGLSPVEETIEEGPVRGAGKLPTEAPAQRVEPKVGDIVSSSPLPNNMESRVFKTSDGYGSGLYDKDSGNVVSGSVTRYKGADAQAKAETRAAELSTKAKPIESKKGAPPELPTPAGFKPKKGRKPQVVMAARLLDKGEITKEQYDQYVNYYMSINPIPEGVLEAPIDNAVMQDILVNKIKSKKDPAKVNAAIPDGTKVGLRMDIPALEWGQANGVNGSVVSIHEGKKPNSSSAGKNISYKSAGVIKNVKFAIRNEGRAFSIAKQVEPEKATTKEGKEVLKDEASKTPQQTMEGEWVNMDPAKIFAMIKEKMKDPAWVQVSMDPLRHSYFYDRATKQPVVEASEVLQVGRFVLAKNVKYADRNEFLYRTAPKGVSGNSKKAVDDVVNIIKQSWTNVPQIEVIQSVSQLPKELRDQMERDGANPKGAYHKPTKTIFLVADNIVGTRDTMLTVAHEAIGHFGLRSILGDNFNKTMLNLYATNDQVRAKADKKIARGIEKIVAIEEVLAEAVEERVGPDTALGKAIQIIRNLMRRAFQAVGIKTINDAEIQELLDRAKDYVLGNIEVIEKASKEGLSAEEKAIADRERDLFSLQAQVPEKVGTTGDLFGGEGLQQIKPTKPSRSPVPEDQLSLFNSDKDFVENSVIDKSIVRQVDIAEAQRVERALKGKTPLEAAKWIAANSTRPDFKLIANRVAGRMQKLMDAGVPFKMHIVGSGARVPVRLLTSNALTVSSVYNAGKKVASVDIWLNNSTVTDRVGTDELTVLHELSHAVTAGANYIGSLKSMQGTEAARLNKRLNDVRNAVVKHFNSRVKTLDTDSLSRLEQRVYLNGANALADGDEILAWGLTDPDMQEYLESIPYKGTTAWNGFVNSIREFLGLPKSKETALSEVLSIADEFFASPLIEAGQKTAVKPTQPIATQDQINIFNASVRGEKVKITPTAAGQEALDTINDLGRQAEETPTTRQKVREYWDNVTDNPQATKEAAKKAAVRFLDKIETMAFSSDAALNNAIRRLINETTMSNQEKMGILLSISSSQAVHPDALANLFIRYGGINYNPSIYKYEAVDKKDNFVSLVQGIDTIGAKYGLTKEQAERVSHTAFEAKRLNSIVRFNQALKVEIDNLRDLARTSPDPDVRDLASKEVRRKVKDFKFVHMTDEQIQRGLKLFNTIPELNALVNTWNGIRENSRKELVESGLWSEEEAEGLLSNMDYVPFYREDQLEKGKGPKEFLRNLQVQAKEKKLKGSDKPVADIFDNMARWTQYAVKRSVMNRLALAKIDAAVEVGIAKKVDKQKQGDNSVRVWRNGEAEYYSLDDPLFMEAFTGLESVAIPSLKYFAKIANMLRQSVVLYPLFSISQVPQDAFAAMFSSGLKTRFALTIPIRAAKEFVKTLLKSSQTHKELERIGVVGIRDFTAAIAREDAEIYAGLKARPGVVNKVKSFLEHIAMASDNAVRQAVYEASIAQGTTRAEAIEKAFNLINFRSRGSSKELAAMGQVIPFFNAYLAAQHVAYRTISGVGISPTDRKAALGTLAATTASVMTLSLIYAMLVGDDDDYLKKPSVMRDRLFMIPGTGLSIPIRSDIFSIPKIITEHTYMLMTDNGASDGRKFRDSMKAALGNALLSPTAIPQAIKPLVEVGINYNFFQGRPLVGTYQKGLETERQFNDSTSELAKLFGQTGMISPIAADHLIRGMFGSVGGLTLYATNFALHNDPEVPRPSMSIMEAIAALPGTSGFVSKEYETALKNDFYVLRDEVSTAVNTLNDLKKRSPYEIEKFLADETNLTRVGMAKSVNKITKTLTDIRRTISQITASDQMSSSEKSEQIRELKAVEQEILQNVDLKSLREMARL